MMHIRIEYTVENCLQSIFNIYEMNNYVQRVVKQTTINKVFNESKIENLVNMYPENTHVYNLLSQYCLLTDNMFTQKEKSNNNINSSIINTQRKKQQTPFVL